MRGRLVLPLVAVCAAAVACSGDDASGPLYPGGSVPATPVSTVVVETAAPPSDTTARDPSPATTGVAPTSGVEGGVEVPSPTAPGGPDRATPLGGAHPLDGLSTDELRVLREVLAADGKLDGSQFPYVALDPPDKDLVLAWQPGDAIPRRAFAVVRREGATFEAVVDLVEARLVSWTEQPGASPGFVNTEFARASGAARQDERFIAGLASRGFTVDDAICLMFAGGAVRGANEQGRRLGRVTCYLRGDDQYYLSRPIEGLYATIDVDTGEVLSVSDSGPVDVPADLDDPDPQRRRPPLAPIGFDTSAGTNVVVDGAGIGWAGWTMRWRADRRTGIEIADVRFDDGAGPRRVLYEAYLSDLFVPYQDPDPAWAFRTLLDSAEFGLGATLSVLQPGVDCPTHAVLLDVPVPNDAGDAHVRPGAACVFERPTGDPAWRHSGSGTDSSIGVGRAEIELVLRFVSTIGNYDYVVDYVLRPDGSIDFQVFAAGIVLQKGVDAATDADAHAAGIDEHGVLVGDGLLATNHDHYMSFRLDLDVGESANSMVRSRLTPEVVEGDAGRSQIWRLTPEVVMSELDARMTPSASGPEVVTFEAAAATGTVGHRPAYEVDFGDAVAVAPGDVSDDPGLRRGGWAEDTVWVTPYRRDERFASGLYVPDGASPAGLPAWTAQDRPLVDTDLVMWFTLGFHHVVRSEDLPTMPAHEARFGLVPTNISPYNPYLDLPQG